VREGACATHKRVFQRERGEKLYSLVLYIDVIYGRGASSLAQKCSIPIGCVYNFTPTYVPISHNKKKKERDKWYGCDAA